MRHPDPLAWARDELIFREDVEPWLKPNANDRMTGRDVVMRLRDNRRRRAGLGKKEAQMYLEIARGMT